MRTGRRCAVRQTALATSLLLVVGQAGAAQAYTGRSAFDSALPATAVVADFDGVQSGTVIPSGAAVDGIAITYALGGVSLKVTGLYPAVSGANALGSTDADVLQDGDDLALAFSARNAIGVSIITKEALQDGDLALSAGGATAVLGAAAVQQTLADGSNVYFLGIVDPAVAFTGATLATAGGGHFFYNLDDLVTAAAADTDQDGVADAADNCTAAPNGPLRPDAGGGSQRDTDGDGYGNACDGDLNDSGGLVNTADLALFRAAFGSADADADLNGSGGLVNAADLALFRTLFGKPPGPSAAHP